MELHDELGQNLTVLKLQIRAIENSLGQDGPPELRQEFQELRQYLDGVIGNVRRLSRDLSPSILEDMGLLSALNYLMEGVGKHRASCEPADGASDGRLNEYSRQTQGNQR